MSEASADSSSTSSTVPHRNAPQHTDPHWPPQHNTAQLSVGQHGTAKQSVVSQLKASRESLALDKWHYMHELDCGKNYHRMKLTKGKNLIQNDTVTPPKIEQEVSLFHSNRLLKLTRATKLKP